MGGGLMVWLSAGVILVAAILLALAYERSRGRLRHLEEDRSRYVRMFDQAYDAILVVDVADGRIHQANPRAGELLGHTPDELRTKTIFDLHFKDDLANSAIRIADAWANGGGVHDDIPFRNAAGARVPVECSARVTEYAGKAAVVLYARDITERLRLQRMVVEKNAQIELQNMEMRSGLRYAQGIQAGMLPSLGQLRASFADAFVLFKPRDIVSGDFHWSARVGNKVVVAAADCTGHGVPGALLSMTGIALLQQIVVGRGITGPAQVLEELRTELLRSMAMQEGPGQLRDGMNIGCVVVDIPTGAAEFSGAFCPLWVVRQGAAVLEEIKGDRIPVGLQEGTLRRFSLHRFDVRKGDRLFMASDGFADQFGGPEGKKFKTSALKELLRSSSVDPMPVQGATLGTVFAQWMGTTDQIDDVMVIGLEV
jgi:PAS domain S-box-containing protein